MANDLIRLLLVEDNPDDVELALLSFNMANLGNPVDVVVDGEEALEYLFGTGRYADRDLDSGPHVVFLDINLPLVNGIEVLERIRAHPLTQALPVVMLTTSSMDSDLARCYELHANSYVVKPLEFAGMADVVARVGVYWTAVNRLPSA